MSEVATAAMESGEVEAYTYQITGRGYAVWVTKDGDTHMGEALTEAEAYANAVRSLKGSSRAKIEADVVLPRADDDDEGKASSKSRK